MVLASVLVTCTATVLHAREQLCDPQFSDCRTPLLNLIRNENRRIDVAFWYMADARYSTAIVERFQAGVHVRVLVDERANGNKPFNGVILQRLKDAGIPMRAKRGGGILHWKVMIFDGQDIVQFSKANYSAEYLTSSPGAARSDTTILREAGRVSLTTALPASVTSMGGIRP